MYRIRKDELANYKAVFFNGKTVRMPIDKANKIKAPINPEIEDVAINSKCYANCPYCYTSATKSGSNFENIVDKAEKVWGALSLEERPFQIAIGGAGESTIHPDWVNFVKTVNELGIVPNYTTNGMHLTKEILESTANYCGGVAVSYHPHIKNVFTTAVHKLKELPVMLNCHIIIGDENSYYDMQSIYETFKDDIKYFVILPYQAAGRGKQIDTNDTWTETFRWIADLPLSRQKQFAFGALFYEWMKNKIMPIDINVYEPEIYSGYRIMDDSYNILRKSSYDLQPK